MKIKYIFYLAVWIFFLMSACSEMNPLSTENDTSQVQLKIEFNNGNQKLLKPANIQEIVKVKVTISGSGMNDIIKELTLSGNTAQGSFDVPKGKSRSFKVEGIDGSNIVQFSGLTIEDLNNDTENISMQADWITPEPVSLYLENVTATTVDIYWSASTAPDIDFYRILRTTSLPFDIHQDKLEDVPTNITSGTISNLIPKTKYYVAVLAIDTEGWFRTGFQTKEFTTASQTTTKELKYDDGTPEHSYAEAAGYAYSNKISPGGTVKLLKARYYITNITGGGTFQSKITTESTTLATKTVTATSTGWLDVDYSSENLIFSEDFWIDMKFTLNNTPGLGFDDSDNGRALFYNYSTGKWQNVNGTFFIRAIVEMDGGLYKLEPNSPPVPLSENTKNIKKVQNTVSESFDKQLARSTNKRF